MSQYRPRRDDDEVAYMVGDQWFEVRSDVQFLEGEHRFVTRINGGRDVEMHVMPEHIQAILWNVD